MDENVLAGLALDESKALTGIEPLYCSLFFQLCFSFLFELFGAFPSPPAQKKGLQVWTCSPLNKSKGFTRATNAFLFSHDCPLLSTRIVARGLLAGAKSMSRKGLTVAAINGLCACKCRFGDDCRRKTACSLAHSQIVNYNVAGS